MPEERQALLFTDITSAIKDKRPPKITGREALNSVAIAEAIYTSANSGKEVSVGDLLAEYGIGS